MAGAIIETISDNDRFLPRYLTTQLLVIMANTIPRDTTVETFTPSAQAKDFISAYKKSELFNPLTYSIFWRENPLAALEKAPAEVDQLDKYGHSALTIALANEDFVLANKLIAAGANIYLEHKLVLEIALTSIIQRDATTMDKILNGTQAEDKPWVKEYLDYLHGHISGNPSAKHAKFRDMLNPTIRHFGQVLDTMVYFNGIPSYYGFISPSLELLINHLKIYLQELTDQSTLSLFKAINGAFTFAQSTCKFVGNIPAKEAAATLAAKVTQNLSSNSRDLVIIPGGWSCNSVVLAIVNKTLIISNLGIGGDPESGTTIYAINNPAGITAATMATFINGLGDASSPTQILSVIGDLVEPKPLFSIKQSLVPLDNCIFVNPRAIIQGALLVLDCYQKNGSATAENLAPLASKIEAAYQDYLNSLYKNSTDELIKVMRNREMLHDKRIECCDLAIEFINQHYKDQDSVKRCLELKNVLEFVGLKDYYLAKVTPEAKAAIQKVTISEQEITAVRVIEQEYTMLGKKQ
jgi:ankyrin repeat protein